MLHLLLLLASLLLPQTPPDSALAKLLERFRANDQSAYTEVVELGEPAITGLVQIMQDEHLDVIARFMAANALGEIGHERAVLPLIAALADPYFNLRRCAALALGKLRDERARKPLEELAKNDPFVYHDAESGTDIYLVRDDALAALALLDGLEPAGGLVKETETFLADAAKLPPSPIKVPIEVLPFPFPGKFREQNIFNNYQQPTDGYVHAGLDILNPAGTEVRALDDGWVALVATNYPDWKTHHFFVVASEKDGSRGWCYTHVDPDTYTFKVGAKIARGEVLGKLVDFSVGGKDGVDHLHLNYVRFARKPDGTWQTDSLLDPLSCFEREDELAPRILEDVRFVKARTLNEFEHAPGEPAKVAGAVDVIAGISDVAYEGQGCNWMVPVVTLEIRGAEQVKAAPWRKLVLDQRGEIGDVQAASALYVKYADKQRWLKDVPAFPVVQFVIATHTDGDGVLEKADKLQCWNTAERDAQGAPRFPNGAYEVTLRAWDLSGNRTERAVKVRVANP